MRRVRVLLDANVIVDAQIRDLFLRLAEREAIDVFWSSRIIAEVRRALTGRLGLSPAKVDQLLTVLSEAFPDAEVLPPDRLVGEIVLPDADDRHVLAAAVHAECDFLVTNNVKDFPDSVVDRFDVACFSADELLTLFAGWFWDQVATVVDQQINALQRPAMTRDAFLERLAGRAPMTAAAVGAGFGIENYARILTDVVDAEADTSPQGSVRLLLGALEAGRTDEVARLVDADLARAVTSCDAPTALELADALREILADVWQFDDWGFATAKRLHGPGVELVKLLRGGNEIKIAFEPKLVEGHLFYLQATDGGWVLVGLDGPDPALAERDDDL